MQPRVKLKGSEFYTHYAVSIILLAPTVAAIYSFATHKYILSAIAGMRIICACTIMASAFLRGFKLGRYVFGWLRPLKMLAPTTKR